MASPRARLLIVDAPGGPAPDVYLSLLPEEIDVRFVLLRLGSPASVEKRLAALRGRGHAVHEVEDRSLLDAVIRETALEGHAEGILAFSERVVHTASDVARSLGLCANPSATQQALLDKACQRRLLAAGGVAVPPVFRIESRDDLAPAFETVGAPAVLKPAIGSSSLSVFAVGSFAELCSIYDVAVQVYRSDPRQCSAPVFVLEGRLEEENWHADPRLGDYVSVESLVCGNEVLHLAVTDKFPLVHPFRETGGIMPSKLPDNLSDALRAEADRAIRALGITVGAVHSEIKMTADGPRVIEVNGRIGGGMVEQLHLTSGYNVVAEMAWLALGREPTAAPPSHACYAAYFLPQIPSWFCRVTRVPSREELLALPGVTFAEVLALEGAEPDWRRGTYECTARAFAAAPAHEDLVLLNEHIQSLFCFERLEER